MVSPIYIFYYIIYVCVLHTFSLSSKYGGLYIVCKETVADAFLTKLMNNIAVNMLPGRILVFMEQDHKNVTREQSFC